MMWTKSHRKSALIARMRNNKRKRDEWAAKQMTVTGTLARMGLGDEPFKSRQQARRRAKGRTRK